MIARSTAEARTSPALLASAKTARRVAQAGIVIGVIAAWIAYPPVEARNLVWPILVGLAAVMCGAYAIVRDQKRVGWGAVAAGVIGAGLGYLATLSGTTHLRASSSGRRCSRRPSGLPRR